MNSWAVDSRVGVEFGSGVSSALGSELSSGLMVDSGMVGVRTLTVLGVLEADLRVGFVAGLVVLVGLADLVGLVVLVALTVLAVLVVDLDLTGIAATELVLVGFLEDALVLARRVESPSIDLFLSIVYNYIMAKLKITKKQQAVLNFLEDFTEENGYSPSYREIQTGLGLSSVSAVAEHIDNMVSKGILKKVPGAARSLEVLDFRHTETVELFRAKLMDASEEERKILLAAADVLGLDLGE